MIIRELKLKLTTEQENKLCMWLTILTSIYNFAIRKIKLDANDSIYYSKFEFITLLSNHSKKLHIPSHTIQHMLLRAWRTWQLCFKKVSREPKLKSIRNKLRSIPFPDPIPRSRLDTIKSRIKLPLLKSIKFHKQDIPSGNIKCCCIIRRASGWYIQLTIDTKHTFQVKETKEKVGIDTGLKDLAILSNGIKYTNHRYYRKCQKRVAQAQRGNNKKLVARLYERIANKRKDYNHKVSRQIIENYRDIYITNDNLRNQTKIFGKSVNDAGINQLRQFILYKGDNHNRKVSLVSSINSTKTCSSCFALTGPSGLKQLNVRFWECKACGAKHDRDINSAMFTLKVGVGSTLDSEIRNTKGVL